MFICDNICRPPPSFVVVFLFKGEKEKSREAMARGDAVWGEGMGQNSRKLKRREGGGALKWGDGAVHGAQAAAAASRAQAGTGGGQRRAARSWWRARKQRRRACAGGNVILLRAASMRVNGVS